MVAPRSRHRTILLVLLLVLPACATTRWQPPPGTSPELVAFALASSYEIAQRAAVDVASDPATPAEVRRALVAADEAALPAIMRLRPLAEEVAALRVEFAAGNIPTDRLRTGIASLDAAIADAAPLLQALLNLIVGVRR